MESIAAGKFKNICLNLMNEVKQKGKTYLITKKGCPVAMLIPPPMVNERSGYGCMKGTATIRGDIISPIDDWSEDESFK